MKPIIFIITINVLLFSCTSNLNSAEKSITENKDSQRVYPNRIDQYKHITGLFYQDSISKNVKHLNLIPTDNGFKYEIKCILFRDSCLNLNEISNLKNYGDFMADDKYFYSIQSNSEGIIIKANPFDSEKVKVVYFENSSYVFFQNDLYFKGKSSCRDSNILVSYTPLIKNIKISDVNVLNDKSDAKNFIFESCDYLSYKSDFYWRGCKVLHGNDLGDIEKLNALNSKKQFVNKIPGYFPKNLVNMKKIDLK